MVARLTRHYTFLFFVLVAFQQSCRTGPVAPTPQPASETEKAESTAKTDAQTKSESTAIDQERSKDPKLSSKPKQSERLPESIVGAPGKELASTRIAYDTVLLERSPHAPIHAGWQYRKDRQSQIVGFEFSNRGGNRILPPRYDIGKNLLFTRDFQFRFDDRARQDIQLFISDWPPSRDKQFRLSELMNSVLHFFPRNYLPAILGSDARYVVTLPTGEQVEFDAKTREILGGVFSETAVDLNPDRAVAEVPRRQLRRQRRGCSRQCAGHRPTNREYSDDHYRNAGSGLRKRNRLQPMPSSVQRTLASKWRGSLQVFDGPGI